MVFLIHLYSRRNHYLDIDDRPSNPNLFLFYFPNTFILPQQVYVNFNNLRKQYMFKTNLLIFLTLQQG